ncbi:serine hydrolase domain-containing protein [Nonomuraea sp. NPDC049400]|uniref:serine hydrolase domain-containing protein n=1 Tax=Nonomuraea sp. NPDC049400 TaxID=3364352 RepID=UPI0037A78229
MTHETSTSRRSVLGLLGAAPIAAGLLTAGQPAQAEASASGSIPADLRPGGKLDRFVADRAGKDLFSGVVLVAQQGRPVLRRAYGMANKASSVPNRLDTRFDIASVTKTFTAVAVAQLAQQGKIAFQEKLGTYLQGFPAEIGQTVTVHQLLTHTSGVGRPAVGSEPPTRPEWDTVQKVWDGTAKAIRALPLQFTPGSRYRYSNDGFFLLGEIVATVSGRSYYDYVREHVFAPAGMTHSDFFTKSQVTAERTIARPYASQPSGSRVDFTTSDFFPFVGGPHRGAYCTATDLLAFARALRNGTLLGPAYAELITTGKMIMSPSEQPGLTRQQLFYGYGFIDAIVGGRHVVGHSGSAAGAANYLDTYPGLGWVALILSNYDTPIAPIVETARQIITESARPRAAAAS